MAMMSKEKENESNWFLYMVMDEELHSLDISKLLADGLGSSSSSRPEFKVVKDYRFSEGMTTLPKRMELMVLDDKLYMVGGKLRDYDHDNWNGICLDNRDKQWANLDILCCELLDDDDYHDGDINDDDDDDNPKPKAKAKAKRPVIICQKSANIPSMCFPKMNPVVVNLRGKIYVLGRSFSGIVEDDWPPLFEVFNPVDGSWKVLPNIPCIDGILKTTYIFEHFTLDHKLVVRSFNLSFYIFDTVEEKWQDAKGILDYPDYPVSGFAQYKDFLVAKPTFRDDIVAYQLDSSGIPRECGVLDNLADVFYPPFDCVGKLLLVNLHDDLMCLFYYGTGPIIDTDLADCTPPIGIWSLRLALFRVYISELSGNRVLSANLEALETYQFKDRYFPPMSSPVIKRGDLTKHGTEAGASLISSNVSGFDRGVPTSMESKSASVLNLSGKGKRTKLPRRLSIPAEPDGTSAPQLGGNKKQKLSSHMHDEEMIIDGKVADYIKKGEIWKRTSKESWFLHIQMDGKLNSLDISDLLARSSSRFQNPPRPEFQVMHNYHLPDGSRLPYAMSYMIVDSNLYLVGGKRVDKRRAFFDDMGKDDKDEEWGNLKVYACELIDEDDPKGKGPRPSIRVFESRMAGMHGPKIDPIVVTLGGKIYVLSRKHYGIVEERWPAIFEVFDPSKGTWDALPNPIFAHGYVGRTIIRHHFAWGTKLVVFSWPQKKMYMFDTRKRKWEDAKDIVDYDVSAFAQFNEFIVALPAGCQELVAFKLDQNGSLKLVRVLGELAEIFDPPLKIICYTNFLLQFGDDGHMCLLYSGDDKSHQWCTRVAVFRLSIVDCPGDRCLHAEFITMETYNFGDVDNICSAAVTSALSAVSKSVGDLALSSRDKPAMPVGTPDGKVASRVAEISQAGSSRSVESDNHASDVSSVSQWLSLIKLNEAAAKHSISLGLFKLALESGCEPLVPMQDELKLYARRNNLGDLGNTLKELLESYHVVENEQ